MNMANNIR
uniref:Death-associated protein 1 n=1 Tax=Triatoma infestans TaxID=30076 RepID=A0A161MJX4_TRIIF